MKEIDFKIKDKEEVFWEKQLRVLQMSIDALNDEQQYKDFMIEMDTQMIEFCKLKLNKFKQEVKK